MHACGAESSTRWHRRATGHVEEAGAVGVQGWGAGGQEPQGSSPFLTRVAGYLPSMDKRVTPHLLWRHGSPLALRVVHGVTGHLLSCVWNLWVFPDDAQGCQCPFVLCLHPQGCLQRGVRASGSFQERTRKLGSFSMWYHPRGYISNFLRRPASS